MADIMTKPRIRVPAGSRQIITPISATGRQVIMFDAGRAERRLRSVPTASTSINTQIRRYGRTVLARSRYLCANNHYASAAKDLFMSALVGSGIKPSPLVEDAALKKEMNELWYDWCDEADADWLTDQYGIQSLAAGEIFEAGECFVRMRVRRPEDNMLVPLQLQLLPAEMLPLDYNATLNNGRRIECGIQFDPIGRREGYWFWRYHPYSDQGIRYERTFVPASEVLHLFKPRVVGQIRGLPHTVSAIAKLAMMDQYDDAELERKRTASLFAGIVIRKAAVSDDDHPLEQASALPGSSASDVVDDTTPLFVEQQSNLGYGLEPGAMIDLAEGEDIKFSEPADVGGNYEVFQYRTLLAIAAGFGVPYAGMTGDLRQANYGSIRAGLVDFRRRIDAMQHHIMIYQFCRAVRERWMYEAVLAGAFSNLSPSQFLINKKQLLRTKWIPPKWEWVDPWKDRQAEKLAVDNGFKSKSDVQEAEGYDPEETDARIAAEQKRQDELGLRLAQPQGQIHQSLDPNDPPVDPAATTSGVDNTDTNAYAASAADFAVMSEKIVEAAMNAVAEMAKPREAPNIAVNIAKIQKTRTRITAHDEHGRISETETEPVDEDE